jgi:membrane-associated phospholipid phosphatase
MSRSEIYAAWALLGALTILVSLHWSVAIDEWAYQWVQYHRGCVVERAARRIDPIVRAVLGMLVGIALVSGGWRRPWYLIGLLLLFVMGAAATELMKTAIERLRPNSIPGMITGNSFPSGHTTGATMAAMIAILLIRGRDWRPWIRWSGYTMATLGALLQGVGRLLTGSHWLSDVSASMLLGMAWVLAAGRLQRLSHVAVASLLAVGCIAFVVFDDLPAARFRLPSALDENRSPFASIEFGTPESRAALAGRWADGPAEPIGLVSWARSPDVSVTLHAANPPVGMLKVTLRPAAAAENRSLCARMVISVNQWVAPEIALARGWREYHVEPPAGALRVGDNTIRFHIVTEGEASDEDAASGLAAFRYLRLYPRETVSGYR